MATYTITTAANKKHLHKRMCVYLIRHKISNKIYVGQTIQQLGRRWRAHLSVASGAGRSAIKAAIAKYGADAFEFQFLCQVETQNQLDAKEIHWIAKLDTLSPNGYNLNTGGGGGKKHSELTIKRMKCAAKARFDREGRTVIPETEAQLAIRRVKWAEASRKRALGNTYRRGQKSSEETCRKITKAKTGVLIPARWKPIVSSDGKVYKSVGHAATAIGCNKSTLMRHLNGSLKSVYKKTYSYYRSVD